MYNINQVIQKIQPYFDKSLTLDCVEEIIDDLTNDDKGENDNSTVTKAINTINELSIIKNARTQPNVLEQLIELCSECRLTNQPNISPNPDDTWESFIKFIVPDQFLTYFTCLIELTRLDPVNSKDRRITLTAGRAYILLQTIPGAKAYHVFHSQLIEKTFELFNLLDGFIKPIGVPTKKHITEHEKIDLYINLISLMEDIEIFMRYVSLEEEIDLKKSLIRIVSSVMLHYYENANSNNKYLCQLYEKCFPILENVCLPMHGEVFDSLFCILNGTVRLNRFFKRSSLTTSGANNLSDINNVGLPPYRSIVAWFIEMLKKIPTQTTDVLMRYIKTVLTNPDINGADQLSTNLDISVAYDVAMLKVCNISVLNYLQTEFQCSSDAGHRQICVEFVARLLSVDADCEWLLYHQDVIKITREIWLLKILFDKFLDISNTTKIKAINCFLRIAAQRQGNTKCQEILQILFMTNPNENCDRSKDNNMDADQETLTQQQQETLTQEQQQQQQQQLDPSKDSENKNNDQTTFSDNSSSINLINNDETSKTNETINLNSKSINGIEHLEPYREKILLIIKHNLSNHSALVRKPYLVFLEYVATNTNIHLDEFVECSSFQIIATDVSPMVRRQLILSMDIVLNARPSQQSIRQAYVKIMLSLANDNDPKVIETIVDSFKRNIFDNIRPYEVTSSEKHMFPWLLLKSMLSMEDSPDLRGCINNWLNKKLLNTKILSYIETHIGKSHTTEAWILMAMVAPKIRSNNPEIVVSELIKSLQKNENDLTTNHANTYHKLEVLASWFNDLKRSTQNQVFQILTDLLLSGGVGPVHVQRVYEICSMVNQKSPTELSRKWTLDLCERCTIYINKHMKSLVIPNLYNVQLINYFYIYTEVITDLSDRTPSTEIVQFLFSYLTNVTDRRKIRADEMLSAKVNCVQNVLTRLALFNSEMSQRTVLLIGSILDTIHRIEVIISAIACLSDLCKKYASFVESVLPYILAKTQHEHYKIREAALQTIVCLVLDDFLKLRGTILMFIIGALTDDHESNNELAHEMMIKFATEKNEILFRTCLQECPFVLNGYMYLDNLEIFADSTNITLKSPLSGDNNLLNRQYVYRFFIHHIEPVYCYLFFEHFHKLLDQVTHEQLFSTSEAQAAIKDYLYIFTHICKVKEVSSKQLINKGGGNDPDNELSDGGNAESQTLDKPTVATTSKVTPTAGSSGGGGGGGGGGRSGRGGNKRGPTIEQALVVVEKMIPMIADLNEKLCDINESFSECIDQLCYAMSEHLEGLTDLAQPQTFWNKYRKQKLSSTLVGKKNKSRKKNPVNGESRSSSPSASSSSSSSSSCESDNNNDNNLPNKKLNKTRTKKNITTPSSSSRNALSNEQNIFKTPTSTNRRSETPTSSRSSNHRSSRHRSKSREKTPSRSSGGKNINSQSESESDRERKASRMIRKRTLNQEKKK